MFVWLYFFFFSLFCRKTFSGGWTRKDFSWFLLCFWLLHYFTTGDRSFPISFYSPSSPKSTSTQAFCLKAKIPVARRVEIMSRRHGKAKRPTSPQCLSCRQKLEGVFLRCTSRTMASLVSTSPTRGTCLLCYTCKKQREVVWAGRSRCVSSHPSAASAGKWALSWKPIGGAASACARPTRNRGWYRERPPVGFAGFTQTSRSWPNACRLGWIRTQDWHQVRVRGPSHDIAFSCSRCCASPLRGLWASLHISDGEPRGLALPYDATGDRQRSKSFPNATRRQTGVLPASMSSSPAGTTWHTIVWRACWPICRSSAATTNR